MNPPGWQLRCPVAIDHNDTITLAHGEGGRLMRQLIEKTILPHLTQDDATVPGDAATLAVMNGPLAFTTDSFVVSPLFFPGGDIGRLSVFGTVNDLVVAGAQPLWMSLAFIIEEGLPMAVLEHVLKSISRAASEANVRIVTGDTKVVPRGAVDGLFINTSGVGVIQHQLPGPGSLSVGDELIVTGPIARHGVAVMVAREQLGLMPEPMSDCACLAEAVDTIARADLMAEVITMRDATRGGVTAVLHEWAQACGHTLTIEESEIPISPEVRGASELLGLDPLHIACEGTMLLAVRSGTSAAVVRALQESSISSQSRQIGYVAQRTISPVTVRRTLGTERALDEPSGAPLPRIC